MLASETICAARFSFFHFSLASFRTLINNSSGGDPETVREVMPYFIPKAGVLGDDRVLSRVVTKVASGDQIDWGWFLYDKPVA